MISDYKTTLFVFDIINCLTEIRMEFQISYIFCRILFVFPFFEQISSLNCRFHAISRFFSYLCSMNGSLLKCFFIHLVLLVFASVGLAAYAKPLQMRSSLSAAPVKELYQKALAVSSPDSATVCYTILIDTFDPKKPKEELNLILDGQARLALIYMDHYDDYVKAYQLLIDAEEKMVASGITNPMVYLILGQLMNTLGEQSGDTETLLTALEYYRKAYASAVKVMDVNIINMAFGNLAGQSYVTAKFPGIADEWASYQSLMPRLQSEKIFTEFNRLLYLGIEAQQNKDFPKAIRYFYDQLKILPDEKLYSSYRCSAYEMLADTYAKTRDYTKAADCIKTAIDVADKYGLRAPKVEMYRLMAEYADSIGNREQAREWAMIHMNLKDSLINYKIVRDLSQMRFMADMSKMEDELRQQRTRHSITLISLFAVVIIVLVALVFIIMLSRRTRQIKKANTLLYKKNEELLKRSAIPVQPTSPQEPNDKDATEEDKQILQQINEVFETSKSIFDSTFSIDTLAALLNLKSRRVSAAINSSGKNFNELVGEYRIKEACKRISSNDPQWTNLTIEALANSVGYSSRSAFISRFSKLTGLTPSQYRKQAKNNKL